MSDTVVNTAMPATTVSGAAGTLVKHGNVASLSSRASGGAPTTITTTSSKLTAYLQDVRSAYVGFEGASTTKQTEVTESGWVANPSTTTVTTDAANQAPNVTTAYTTSYVPRADYFVAQDVHEGSIFYGLVNGHGTTYKPVFQSYRRSVAY